MFRRPLVTLVVFLCCPSYDLGIGTRGADIFCNRGTVILINIHTLSKHKDIRGQVLLCEGRVLRCPNGMNFNKTI